MKMKTVMLVALFTALSQGALAEPLTVGQIQMPAEIQPLTQEQTQQAIATLLQEGIIEWVDGHFVVKDQNALEQLRQRGRVDLQAAAYSVICY
ncbi:MAG: hypothetical protein AB7K68_16300 [Bacteriovoracia bacterium]